MEIVCLKWGDKFNHEHVNRLYKMVKKNFYNDFTFVCYTENSHKIDKRIDVSQYYKKENLYKKKIKFQIVYI